MDWERGASMDDLIRAVRCIGSKSCSGDCYADLFNLESGHNKPDMICGCGEDLIDEDGDGNVIGCPYHQKKYSTWYDNGDCREWLNKVADLLEELEKYKEIGTLEECREAVEKQKAVKPIEYEGTNRANCPICFAAVRGISRPFGNWCSHCGQKLEW